MMSENFKFPDRKSMRLRGYDYSRAGLYFITVCVQDRLCLFGKIMGDCPDDVRMTITGDVDPRIEYKMALNPAGQMVAKWYHELQNKYPTVRCHEWVVMPNHFHCVIEILEPGAPIMSDVPIKPGAHVGTPPHGHPNIGNIMDWFKTMTTNEYIRGVKQYGWQRFNKKLWQRNYYDHIIRNEKSYNHISNYILNNPSKWKGDRFFKF